MRVKRIFSLTLSIMLACMILFITSCTNQTGGGTNQSSADTKKEEPKKEEPKKEEPKKEEPAKPAAKKQMSFGTATIGGAYYPIGQAIANLVTKYGDGITMTPEVTGGAVENPRLVDSKDVEIGITNANIAYFAANGEKPYDKKLNVSALASLYPSVFHVIVRADSPIKSIADLKGKKVAVGPAGGGTLPVLEAALEDKGLKMTDIVPSYLAFNDGFTQLADGNVDVALALSGYPASGVVEISVTKKIRFIDIEEDSMERLNKKYPYYTRTVVPKDTYKLDKDAIAIGVQNVLVVRNDMDAQLAYSITKIIFEHLPEFQQETAIAKQIDVKEAPKTPIPLHPGAKKYFDEKK